MQQIERYGIIALVLLLVTIVAVSFWGERGGSGLWSRITGRGKTAVVEPRRDPAMAAQSVRRSMGEDLPLSVPTASPSFAPASSQPAADLGPGSAAGLGVPAADPLALSLPPAQESAAPADAYAPQARGYEPVARETSSPEVRTAPASSAGHVYVVQKGDSLSEIAQKTLGSSKRWTEIKALNPGVDPARLSVGTKLVLPGSASASPASTAQAPAVAAAKPAKPAAAPAKSRTCTIRKGDTLSRIAARELGSPDRWRELAAANPGVDPSRLVVGAALKVPTDEPARVAQKPAEKKSAPDEPVVASNVSKPSTLRAVDSHRPKVK